MKRLSALALFVIALGAIMYFWLRGDPQPMNLTAAENPAHRDSVLGPSSHPKSVQPPPTFARSPEQAAQSGIVERPPATAARIELRVPDTIRSGDTFSVTIDVQALRAMRRLQFSVTYKKSILRLLGSSPGAFAQRAGASVQFEESSDGYLIVRIEPESGVIAGAGSFALLEFQALKRGESPLSVQDVTYVEVGGQEATTPVLHEGSITVD